MGGGSCWEPLWGHKGSQVVDKLNYRSELDKMFEDSRRPDPTLLEK